MASGSDSGLEVTIKKLQGVTPNATSSLQDVLDLALEGIKVYRPEITRLDEKTDGIKQQLQDLSFSSNKTLLEHHEVQQLLSRRCTQLETRMAAMEALTAVLPTWKEDLMNKIDSVGRDARVKHQQICMRAQMLEDQQTQQGQATRERLDGLTTLAKTMQESRQAHAERMDSLEKNIRTVDARCEEALKELQSASAGHARELLMANHKLTEHGVQLSVDRIDLDTLRQKALQAEQDNGFNKADILIMQDKQELFQQQVVLMDKQLKANESIRNSLTDRVSVLERDSRVQALQATAADYVAFKAQVSDFMTENGEQYAGLGLRLADMDSRIDKGPPGLWKITEQVAAQAEELAAHKDKLVDGSVRLAQLQEGLDTARKLLEDQKELSGYLQSDSRAMSDRLVSEMKRCLAYVDSRVEQLSAKYEVEALRRLIESIQRELQEAIASMGHRVKFELLHDEIPQVNTLKAYIQQTEHAMARTMDRLGWIETGLAQESQRGEAVQAEWALTKSTLDSLILDGTFDLARIQRELQGFKDTFEELGHMAARGQIVTLSQAEDLIDKALRGPAVDAIVGKKLADSKVLQQELSGYVPRHELEGLRRVLASGASLTMPPPSPATSSLRDAVPGGQPTASPDAGGGQATGSSATDTGRTTHPIQGAVLLPPTKGLKIDDSTLLAVYKRLEVIDEAMALNSSLSKSLQTKVDATARELSAVSLQFDSEVPSLKRHVSELQAGLGRSGVSLLQDAEGSLRELVNKTLLPDVIERQAADMMRLVKYVNGQMNRVMSSGQEQVQELQTALKTLEGRVSKLQGPAAAAARQAVAPSADPASRVSQDGDGNAGRSGDKLVATSEPGSTLVDDASASVQADGSGSNSEGPEPSPAAITTDCQHQQHQAQPEGQHQTPSVAGPELAAAQELEAVQGIVSPSVHQLGTLVRAATVRLDAVEKLVSQLVQAAVSSEAAGTDLAAGQAELGGGLGNAGMSDLSVLVHELKEQLPLLARGFEVEGLKHSLAQLRQEMHTKLRATNTGPVLNLTLACPTPLPHQAPPFPRSTSSGAKAGRTAEAETGVAPAKQPAVSRSQSVRSDQQGQYPGASPPVVESAQEQTDQDKAAAHAQGTPPDSIEQAEPVAAGSSDQPEAGSTPEIGPVQPVQADSIPTGDVVVAAGEVQPPQPALQHPEQNEQQEQQQVQEEQQQEERQERQEQQASDTCQVATFQVVDEAGQDQASECWALLQQHCAWQKVVADHLSSQLAALQLAVQTTTERSAGVEQRLLATSAQWQQGFAVIQHVVPRVEQLAASTQTRVQHMLSSSDQLVKIPELEGLLAQSTALQAIKQQLDEMQDLRGSVFVGQSAGSFSCPPAASSAPSHANLHTAQSAPRPEKRSHLPTTDLEHMPLPLPQLLPSFMEDLKQMSGQANVRHPEAAEAANTDDGPQQPPAQQGHPKNDVPVRVAGAAVPEKAHVGSATPAPPHPGPPGWEPDTVPRHLVGAEHADTELSGIMHDLMHACFNNLVETKDGPLPGVAAADTSQGCAIREAALKRLRMKPFAVQQHVELLEGAKQQLGRLVGNTAVSTVDYLSLYCLMLDIRLKLAEDTLEVHKEQAGAAFRNLETAFTYMKRLQDAINNKGSVQALAAVDRCLRSVGQEMMAMGNPPVRGGQPGLLYGSPLGSPEFWSPYLSLAGAELSGGRFNSPPPSASRRRTSERPPTGGSPRTSSAMLPAAQRPAGLVVPSVVGTAFGTLTGTAFPPPSFLKDKRDILAEQQHVINVLKVAEQQLNASGPLVQYVGASGRGLPVIVKKRPSTAKPDLRG